MFLNRIICFINWKKNEFLNKHITKHSYDTKLVLRISQFVSIISHLNINLYFTNFICTKKKPLFKMMPKLKL